MKTFSRIKNMVLSGVIAFSAVVSPLAAPVATEAPSLTATAADNDNYARLLQYSLYFYDANMCGDNSSCGLNWRSNCHMTDEVKGGFHDAGDHAMFGLPQGYTAATLGWSYYEFKDAFTATGQDAHLKVITDKFCDFFKASTKLSGGNVSNFLYQKGDGNEDHSYWGPPEQQGSRKMYWTSNGASDIAAEYAAALAANYVNFNNSEDLTYAKALYKFSKQYNQVAVDGPKGFYNSNGCADEQAWAAGWLYLATNDSSYLNDLKSNLPKVGWVHGWNDAHLGAACLYGEITKDWSAANSFMSSKANGSNYMFLDKWGSARLNCSMQMTALIATKNGGGNYKDWAKGQMNYILGSNPANTCFVTGFASNSAKNAHHRAASGYTSYEQFNMNNWNPDGDHMSPYCAYGSNSKPLIGALVGGPCDASGSYHDNMADYICNEVAIDYNAGLVGAAAGLYHFYQTGSIDNSINGVTKIYKPSSTPGPNPTTTTTRYTPGPDPTTTTTKYTPGPDPSGDDIILYPEDMDVGTETGSDGNTNNYAEFAHQGATSATLYLKVNSSDTEVSGEFGTWTGKWEETFFEGHKVGANKIATIDYTIPSNAGSTIKAIVWWPHGNDVTIQKVVLHKGSSSSVTTTKYTPGPTTTTTKYTPGPDPSGNDIVLYPEDMTVDTETGSDGNTNNYAEFAHQGAKSATLYLKVNSSDTEVSGEFGTWTGKWEETFFEGHKVGANKIATVDYTIPSNAGSTIKAIVWWPHGNDVTIQKVVLHMDSSSNITTTKATTTTTTTTTRTTTVTKPVTTGGTIDLNINNATVQVYTPNRELLLSGYPYVFDISGVSLPALEQGDTVSGTLTFNPANNKVISANLLVVRDDDIIYGDANCNGKIQMNDAVLVMQVLANADLYGENGSEPTHITAIGRKNGDCYIPGTDLTNKDALTIQKYLIHSVTSLPVYN